MKIAIDCGHTLVGSDTGAQGCGFREENKTREIGDMLMALLIQGGHTVVDCTVDSADSLGESLAERVRKANENNVNLYISIHLNAFNGDAHGVETHVYQSCSQTSRDYANKVQANMVALGYTDRGIKEGNLYVVKNTNAPAVLVECGFIDNCEDMSLYNAESTSKAITNGIIGEVINVSIAPQPKPIQVQARVNWDDVIAELQNQCNIQGFSSQSVDSIPGVNTLNGCPTLEIGDSGEITLCLQKLLNRHGYNLLEDGDFGNNTLNAVLNFQMVNCLSADGVVGKNTWSKLLGL